MVWSMRAVGAFSARWALNSAAKWRDSESNMEMPGALTVECFPLRLLVLEHGMTISVLGRVSLGTSIA